MGFALRYGASGTIQYHDAVCSLDITLVTEKVFLILWFWLLVGVVLVPLNLAFRYISFPLFFPLSKYYVCQLLPIQVCSVLFLSHPS